MEVNKTTNVESLLQTLNDEKVTQMIPVIVYMSVLMITGILGNGMVCYYYGFQTRRTSNTLFIIGLAVFDLIICTVTIPMEIYDVRYFYLFYNVAFCKCMRFVTHFASVSGATILMAIAIDRYRRICRPFIKQYNLKDAVRAIVISVGIALFLSWPAFILYVPVKVLVNNGRNVTLYGSDCTTTRESSLRVAMWVFNGMYLLLFIVSVIVLSILYYLITKVLFTHNKVQKKYSRPIAAGLSTPPIESRDTDTGFSTVENKGKDTRSRTKDTVPRERNHSYSTYSFKTDERDQPITDLETNRERTDNSNHFDIKTIKYTIVMLSITIAFVISYLPYLILAIWRVFLGAYEVNVLSDTGLVLFNIGVRSYMLNSAVNPFLYGFFNSGFRQFFYRVFCPCCKQVQRENTTSSSSDGQTRN